MTESQPVDISQFISSVELERVEPKSRFNPESADYDPILDKVMTHFPTIKSWYKIGYREYTSGKVSGLQFKGDYKQEVMYPTLIASKVINELNHFHSPQDNVPYLYNPAIIAEIVHAAIPNETNSNDLISQIINIILTELPLTEDELEGFTIANSLFREADFYRNLDTEKDIEISKVLKAGAYEELNKRRPLPIVKEV